MDVETLIAWEAEDGRARIAPLIRLGVVILDGFANPCRSKGGDGSDGDHMAGGYSAVGAM